MEMEYYVATVEWNSVLGDNGSGKFMNNKTKGGTVMLLKARGICGNYFVLNGGNIVLTGTADKLPQQKRRSKMSKLAQILMIVNILTMAAVFPCGAAEVHQYNLDEGLGTNLTDKVGTLDGTLNGTVTWQTSGPEGGTSTTSLDFGGTAADYVDFGILGQLNNTTWALWAKADGDHTGQILMSSHNGGQYCEFGFDSNGNLMFRVASSGGQVFAGSTGADPFTAAEFNDGNWHHFSGTYDGTNVKVYADGNLVESLALTGTINHTNHLMLGRRPHATSAPYNGKIGGQVRIYRVALSAEEINELRRPPAGTVVIIK